MEVIRYTKDMEVIRYTKDQHCILMKIMQAHVQNCRWNVQYYTNLYDPEHKHNHGFSVAECLRQAEDVLENAKRDYKDFINSHPDTAYFSHRYDAIKAMRDVLRQELRDARDYDHNPHIVMSALRTAAKVKQLLITLEPKYAIYSAKFFRNN